MVWFTRGAEQFLLRNPYLIRKKKDIIQNCSPLKIKEKRKYVKNFKVMICVWRQKGFLLKKK